MLIVRLILLLLVSATAFGVTTNVQKKIESNRDVIQPFNYEGVELLPGRLTDQYNQVKDFYL